MHSREWIGPVPFSPFSLSVCELGGWQPKEQQAGSPDFCTPGVLQLSNWVGIQHSGTCSGFSHSYVKMRGQDSNLSSSEFLGVSEN